MANVFVSNNIVKHASSLKDDQEASQRGHKHVSNTKYNLRVHILETSHHTSRIVNNFGCPSIYFFLLL